MAAASGDMAEGRGMARRNLHLSEAGGEGRGVAVEVGESGVNGGVEREDGREQVTQHRVVRAAETLRHGGRHEGVEQRNLTSA